MNGSDKSEKDYYKVWVGNKVKKTFLSKEAAFAHANALHTDYGVPVHVTGYIEVTLMAAYSKAEVA